MLNKTPAHLQGIVLVSLAGICWGAMANFAQYIFAQDTIDARSLSVIRLLSAGILMLIGGTFVMGRRLYEPMMRARDAIDILINGCIIFGAHYTFFCTIYYANAGLATILLALVPLIAGIWTCLRTGRMMSLREILCFILAFGGVTLIVTAGDFSRLSFPLEGILYGLASALIATIGSFQPRPVLHRVGVFPVLCWGMLFGGIMGSIIYPVDFSSQHWQIPTLLAFAFVVIVGTIIAFACYFAGLKRVTPVEAGLLNCMEPLSTYVFLIAFMGLTLNLWEMAGIVAVLANVALLSVGRKRD